MRYAYINKLSRLVDSVVTSTSPVILPSDEVEHYELVEIGEQDLTDSAYIDGNFVSVGYADQEGYVFNPSSLSWEDGLSIDERSSIVLNELRSKRDALLKRCDWTQVADAPVDKDAWKAYRQALRDLPDNYDTITNIDDVEWPVPPQEI